jgi:peptide/nickel transport system substrate-binding protein
MQRKSVMLVLSLMLVLSTLLASCGAAATPESAAPTISTVSTPVPPTPVPATEVPPTAAPKVLTIAVPTEPTQIDPINFSESIAHSLILHTHNGLFKFDSDLNPVPDLAESAEVAADGVTWTIKLKQGIKFHDGTPFTADAVKYVVDWVLSDNPPIRAAYAGRNDLDSATVIDDYTVQIKTKKPLGAFLQMLASPAWYINSPAAYEKYGDQASLHPVGTGPYKFVEWNPGEDIVLERNTDYFGQQPYYDKLIWRFVLEPTTRVTLLETGEVDVVVNVPASEMSRLEDNANLVVEPVMLGRMIYIAIHCQRPYLDDVRVRQALNYAVDKEAIVKGILQGLGRVADSPIPSLTWGYSPVGEYPYDPDKARQLLADAGVPEDFTIKLWVPEGRYFQDKEVGEAVANYLGEVGLNVDFQVFEWGAYLSSIRKPIEEAEHDLYLLGWSSDTLDADHALSGVLDSAQWPLAGANRGFYKNETVDAMLEEARTSVDPAQRMAMYADISKMIWDDAPWIFLHEMETVIAYRKGITGIWMQPAEPLDLTGARE